MSAEQWMQQARGFLRAWSKRESAARTACPECHFESSEGCPPSHAPGCSNEDVISEEGGT